MEEPISSLTQPGCEVHRDKELQCSRQDRFIWIGFRPINRRKYRRPQTGQSGRTEVSRRKDGRRTKWFRRFSCGSCRVRTWPAQTQVPENSLEAPRLIARGLILVGPTYRAAAFPVFACRFLPSFRLVHGLLAREARW